MDLKVYSRWFDDIAISDAYSGVYLYLGQVSSFIDSQVDGTISRRRVLSLDPDFALPEHRVISYLGENWLAGDGIKDGVQAQAVRASYAMHKVNERYTLCTPGQAALGQSGTNVFGQKSYLKSTVNGPTDAEYDPFWEIYISQSEEVLKGYFLVSSDGEYHRARGKHDLLEGFRVVEADQLDDGCYVQVSLQPSTFDPITETYSGSTRSTSGIMLDAYQAYEYKTQADPKYSAGDNILIVSKLAGTITVGQSLSIQGRSWKVFSVLTELDAWKCLVRLA